MTHGDPEAESEARQQMHQMHVALELKNQELQGLKRAIKSKKKRQKKKKVLPLSLRDPNVQGGAIFWDPASKARADWRMRDTEKQKIAEAAAKANRKQLQLNTKVLREKTKADNKVVAEQRRREVAERRAQEAPVLSTTKSCIKILVDLTWFEHVNQTKSAPVNLIVKSIKLLCSYQKNWCLFEGVVIPNIVLL